MIFRSVIVDCELEYIEESLMDEELHTGRSIKANSKTINNSTIKGVLKVMELPLTHTVLKSVLLNCSLTNLLHRASQTEFLSCRFEDLFRSRLTFSTFKRCDFSGVDMREAYLEMCIFKDCNFGGADLSGSKQKNIIFDECKFGGANFGE